MTNEEIAKIKYVLYHGYDVEVKSRSGNGYILHKDFDQPEAIDFLLNTGLRSGELLALKYEMWDPEKKTINIQNARVTYTERDKNFKGKLVTTETDPKNSASKTVLKLTNKANELLQILHSKEPEGYTGYIVHQKNGDPIAVSSLECRIKRIITAAGLSGITPHDFRHTFASVLYEVSGGDLQLVRKKLRHKDATTTANIYVDLRSDREDEYDLQIEI